MRKGVRIGDWELVRQLNSGGMGQVWQARKVFATGAIRSAAIKLLRPSGVLDKRSRDALLTEADIQMRLQHPNIPKIVDVGIHEGLPFLVMDYIAGKDLSQFLSRLRDLGSSLDPLVAAHVGREVAYALDYAHNFEIDGVRQEVVHRDVAPKNIMIGGKGAVFVLDFGIAEARSHQTSRNSVKGTLLYMAPEHAQGFPGPSSDAFGLGASLWEMLENRVFRSEVPPEQLRSVVNDGWVPPLTRPGVDKLLRFIVEGLLRRDARERLKIADVIEYFESADFPVQRGNLGAEMRRCFGGAVLHSGQTLHEFKISDELDQALAAGEVAMRSPPLVGRTPTSWSKEAFSRAGAPAVIAISHTRPIVPDALDDDDDSREPTDKRTAEPPQPPEARVRTERISSTTIGEAARASIIVATQRVPPPAESSAPSPQVPPPAESSAPRPQVPPPAEPSAPRPRAQERTTPMTAAGTPPAPSTDSVPALPPMRAIPARATRRRRGPALALGLLGAVALGLGAWALVVLPRDPPLVVEGPLPAPTPVTPVDVARPVADDGPDEVEVGRAHVEVGPDYVEVAQVEVEAVPDEVEATSDEPDDPEAAPPPDEPLEEPPAVEPAPEPEDARRPKGEPAVVRSKLFVAVGFVEAMDISVGGVRRTLRMSGPDRTTFLVRPGRRVVRWGPPGQPLVHRTTVTIAKGTDYNVRLGAQGPAFGAIAKGAP